MHYNTPPKPHKYIHLPHTTANALAGAPGGTNASAPDAEAHVNTQAEAVALPVKQEPASHDDDTASKEDDKRQQFIAALSLLNKSQLHCIRIALSLPYRQQASRAELLERTKRVIGDMTPGSDRYQFCVGVLLPFAKKSSGRGR